MKLLREPSSYQKKQCKVLKEHIEKQEGRQGIESDLVFTEPDGRPIAKNNLGSRYREISQGLWL